jgi:DNA-nicking Smr family endonuclease
MMRPPPKRPRRLSADEMRLWAAAMKDARPLPGRALPEAPPDEAPAATAPDLPRPVAPVPRPAPRPPRPELSHGDRDRADAHLRDLDGSTAEKLRRGRLPIEARLDLHGLTQEAAWRELDGFLNRAQAAGRRSLLVITGTGFRARLRRAEADDAARPFRMDEHRPGVLRDALPRWLSAPHNKARVVAWSPAQPRDGGAGAFYVLLRRRR